MRLVPTQTHVERALGERASWTDARATTLRGFVRDTLALLGEGDAARPATLAAVRPATRVAIEADVGPFGAELPEEAAGRVALAHAVDRAVGRLRRAGASADVLRAASRPRANRIAAVMRRVDEQLAAAGLFDPRAAGAV